MNNSITRHIPNFLTCMNLLCGCLAIVYIFKGNIPVFTGLIAASLVFDFLDGFAARALNANSPMGKELDSLADMVSFGLVPACILYHIFISSIPVVLYQDERWGRLFGYFPFIIAIFSALRLAMFNIDTRQSDSFIGLPTPAVTIFVAGMALILHHDYFHITPYLLNSYIIAGLSMVLSFLLVADIPLLALKFKSFAWGPNRSQYSLIILSIINLAVLGVAGIPVIIILYLILSVIHNQSNTSTEPSSKK